MSPPAPDNGPLSGELRQNIALQQRGFVIGVYKFPLFTRARGAYINGRLMLKESISLGRRRRPRTMRGVFPAPDNAQIEQKEMGKWRTVLYR
jgi:hypothetical protein